MSQNLSIPLHFPIDSSGRKPKSSDKHSRSGSLVMMFGADNKVSSSESFPKNAIMENNFSKRMSIFDNHQSYFEVGGRSSINFGFEKSINHGIKGKKFPNYTSKLGPARHRQSVSAKSLMLKDDNLYYMMKIQDRTLPLKSSTLRRALTLKTGKTPGLKQGNQGKNITKSHLKSMDSNLLEQLNDQETIDNPSVAISEVLKEAKRRGFSSKNIVKSSNSLNFVSPATQYSKEISKVKSLLEYQRPKTSMVSKLEIPKSKFGSKLSGNERKHLDLFFSNRWIVKFIRTKYADDEYFNKEIDKEVNAAKKQVKENLEIRDAFNDFISDKSLPPTSRKYVFHDDKQSPEEYLEKHASLPKSSKDQALLEIHLKSISRKDGRILKDRRHFLSLLTKTDKRNLMIRELREYCRLLIRCDVPLEELEYFPLLRQPFMLNGSVVFINAIKSQNYYQAFQLLDENRYLIYEYDSVPFHSFQIKKTALHHVCETGNAEIVQELIDRLAIVDCLDAFGKTPLFYSLSKGNHEIVEILLMNRAFPFSRENCRIQCSKNDYKMKRLIMKARIGHCAKHFINDPYKKYQFEMQWNYFFAESLNHPL